METNANTNAEFYILRHVTEKLYRHCDPYNGLWWGPAEGAMPFDTLEDAIKFGQLFTGGEPFRVDIVTPD